MSIPLLSLAPDHIHPILVNFTAALVPASFASDVFGCTFRKHSLHVAAWWTLIYATALTPLTALAGLLWKKSVGSALPPETIMIHQWLGISLAIALIILAIWRWSIYARSEAPGVLYILLAFIVVLALVWQGTLGGEMVFG